MQNGRTDVEPAPATYSAADPARFEITSYRGTLRLNGNTTSGRHEQRLLDTAGEHFPDHTLGAEFRALGVAPAWWADATTELLSSLATTDSPSALLVHDSLEITAIVPNKPAAERRFQVLEEQLPASANINIRLTQIDSAESVAVLCERQFEILDPGPVGFEESGTELRASAYLELDRVIALADACRDASISITGHTDSTGNETWNEQLSLARAKAVATYLESRGIEGQRLIAQGAGSSQPVADNRTRYGRGLNRRIEISLAATSD